MSSYKQSGVDIDAGEEFARMIKQCVEEAWPQGGEKIGGFAGGGPIPEGATRVQGSNDGTGTKIILAALTEIFDGIGQDGVAMAAVDGYIAGASPTYLLDTFKTGHLVPNKHIEIIKSLIRACKLACCRLIGGETAEMPGFYKYDWICDLDCTAIGFPAESGYTSLAAGQRVIGWPSHGIAANGFSLVRKVFRLNVDGPAKIRTRLERSRPYLGGETLAEVLLEPTPIYISQIEKLKNQGFQFASHAHITGGGLPGNVPRIFSGRDDSLKVVIDRSSWKRPPIFGLVQDQGKVKLSDMERTFNNGIMVVSIIDGDQEIPYDCEAIEIGQVEDRKPDEDQLILTGKYRDA